MDTTYAERMCDQNALNILINSSFIRFRGEWHNTCLCLVRQGKLLCHLSNTLD